MDATAQHMMAQLRQNPLDPNLLEALRSHCENVGDVTTWADALELHARAASLADADPIELGRLHFELGNLYRDRLGRSDRAISHYRTAIDFDAAQRPAIAAARAIFADAGKWDQVAKLLAREAESLPDGPKRAALLKDRAHILKKRLQDLPGAIEALREAVALTPGDLGLQHELATLLLDQADSTQERDRGRKLRQEAADILCGMARNVSDDYAFAYVEAALDAIPDHEPALRMLQTISPRLGRADAIPARWVASLQYAPEGPMSRELRLKLAIAYRTAGQKDDALVCLQPLLDRGDAEALALIDEIGPKAAKPTTRTSRPAARGSQPPGAKRKSESPSERRKSESPSERRKSVSPSERRKSESPSERRKSGSSSERHKSTAPAEQRKSESPSERHASQRPARNKSEVPATNRASQPPPPKASKPPSQPITSSLFELDPDDLQQEPSNVQDLSAELADLRAQDASSPLSDLASLFTKDASDDRTIVDQSPIGDADDADVTDDEEPPETAAALEVPEHEELTTSGVEELRRLIAADLPEDPAQPTPVQARELEPEFDPEPITTLGLPEEEPAAESHPAAEEEPTAPGGALSALTLDEDAITTAPGGAASPLASLLEDEVVTAAGFDDVDPRHEQPAATEAQVQARASASEVELPDETTKPRGESSRASGVPVAAVPQIQTRRESRAPQPPPVQDISEEPEDELTTLRRELKRRLRFRDRRGAAELAERLLALGHLEAEAITALEDQYRMTRDFRRMRDLAMRIAGDVQVPVDQRLARLREAAMLSESKLGDVDGTVIAWHEVLALLPTDDEANNKLRRLLTRLSRWEDLCELLAQRAEADPDLVARAARYREIATLHRDRRKSLTDAIANLEHARALDPDEPNDVVVLCDLYVAAGRHTDAAASYEMRIAQTEEPVERVPLLMTLGDLYENDLSDLEAAYRSAETLLLIAPRHVAALDRLLRIDGRLERWDNVVRVLEAKLAVSDGPARVKLHARIAELSLRQLNDPSRAADAYASALDITPDDKALLLEASEAFELAGRREELTESIVSAAQHAREAAKRFDLYQLVAERREVDGDISAAIAAREAQLAVRRDSETLRQLVTLLRRTDRANDLVRRLDELARTEQPQAARELRLERAAVLAEQLSNLEAAKGELTRVLEEIAPDDVQVLEMLVDLCRRSEDVPRRTAAQERLVKLASSIEAKVDLVTDLVDTFVSTGDDEGAMRVLRTWIGFEQDNPQPYLRIAPLLEKTGQRAELLSTYDSLSRLAMAEDEVGEYQLRGARVGLDLADYEGAWSRLVPRVVDANDAAAETLLQEVAEKAGRAEALAELYIGLAQRDEGKPEGLRRWLDAARTYETLAHNHDKALEAVLRAFAKNLDDAALLAEADRLAELARAWPRLSQVYDALVRRAESPKTRSAILMRHAKLLEERAQDPQTALARVSLAFQVDPAEATPFAEATRLAKTLAAHEPLLALYERRALADIPLERQLDALLEACRTAHIALEDTARATSYLARAVILANGVAELLDSIEARALALDAENPQPHGRGLVHALSEVYAREAQEGGYHNALAALLWTRAAKVRDQSLGDLVGAYQALEQASLKKLTDEGLLDALVELATRAGQLEALARHLSERAENAIDSSTASAALSRLGGLYEGPLASHDLAAETFAQLVKLNPRDAVACSRLRGALKAGNKHQELLLTIERQLVLSPDAATRLALLREAAVIWEREIANRFEALDAWRKVLALEPNDREAEEAIVRLRARPALDDLALLDGDLVVRPEDLRPSMPPPPPESKAPEPEAASEPEPDETPSVLSQSLDATAPDSLETGANPAFGAETEAANQSTESAAENEAALADDRSPDENETSSEPPQALDLAPPGGELTPVAGAAVLAHLAGEVAALHDDEESEDRISELERAAFEASHAQPASQADLDVEPLNAQGDSSDPFVRPTSPGEPPAAMNHWAASATDSEAAEEADEPSPLEASLVGATEALAPSSETEAAHADHADHDADQTLILAETREAQRMVSRGAEAEAEAETALDEDGDDAAALDDLDHELAQHLEDAEDPVDLNALSSIVADAPAVRSAGSRIPPPPPAGARSTPPSPPKSIRPPPPPRRD